MSLENFGTLELVRAMKHAEGRLRYHKRNSHAAESLCRILEAELERRARRAWFGLESPMSGMRQDVGVPL